jgi:uncharacterized RmlC-like cupin family protein
MRRRFLPVIGAVVIAAAATAQSAALHRLTAEEIAAKPPTAGGAGTSGVDGIRTTILSGDPTKAGLYTIALRVPANTRIAAHRHRDERSATVIEGSWHFGFGAKANDRASKALGPGSFYTEPAGVDHFARTGSTPVVLHITGMGPSDTRHVEVAKAHRDKTARRTPQ